MELLELYLKLVLNKTTTKKNQLNIVGIEYSHLKKGTGNDWAGQSKVTLFLKDVSKVLLLSPDVNLGLVPEIGSKVIFN